jgi:hypothetical protein
MSGDAAVHADELPWLVGALLAPFHRRKHEAEFRARRATAQPPQDAELDALSDRLFDLPGVVQLSWLPFNRDQVIYVGLDPWSDGTAEQVRQAATPGRSGSSADATPSLPRTPDGRLATRMWSSCPVRAPTTGQ